MIIAAATFLYLKGVEIIKIFLCKPFYFELNICYPVAWGKEGIEAHLASLCAEAVDAVKSGHNILVVSDRKIGPDSLAIPA